MVELGEVSASTAIGILRSDGEKAYEKLQEGLEKAKAKGKGKATKKHMAAGGFKREVKKVAPRLFVTLREVRADPAYKSIGEGLREKLEKLLGQLDGLDGIDEALAEPDEAKKTKPAAKRAVAKEAKVKVEAAPVSERAEPVRKKGPVRVVKPK
jgi:hypothetical protein